ncbi:uncharacterized protein LOC130980528 [Arachis stenosperma]|uniref:uncharacterized protein LOC130980528 n=1 Tax=Arachis stenosperma TaxID=217475 RepID=UPI0025AB99AE|nr:uncharacterized protein LOC130980528 [Arachis stenosperma]
MEVCHLVRDLEIQPMIWKFHPSKRDEIHRAYLKAGPNQSILDNYPFMSDTSHRRRFQASWFELYPSWLEYSIEDDAVYYLPCYLFAMESSINTYSNAFIENDFRNWKKVNSRKDCPLLNHIGKGPNSFHHRATKSCDDLMKKSQHVDTLMKQQTSEKIENNQRRLGASIDYIRWLTSQGCAYRVHDESSSSDNRGHFIELLKFLSSYNSSVQKLILENAPRFAKYTSSDVHKEILHVLATMVRNSIRKDIGDAKFCIIINEARDKSKKEQMAIILRFVDVDGFVRERFFDLVHVIDTSALTLKKELVSVLSIYNLQIENIRGQGYDGASNMRGEWNGLQALFLNDCRQAYYVHCFAHRLQLALVAASREVLQIHEFFTQLTVIVNIVGASYKRHDQLQEAQEIENTKLIANDELDTDQGANQMGTLQRVGDTRWSSHFHSICSLIRIFAATHIVFNNIIDDGTTSAQRGEAYGVNKVLFSFEFVFSLHLMKKIMGITNILCQALQQKFQVILNAMHVVSTSKLLLQKLRDNDWCNLLEIVKKFCEKHEIDIPDMNTQYTINQR